jgi:hypothetical protein
MDNLLLAFSDVQIRPKVGFAATSGRPKNYHFEISSFRALRSAAAVLPIGDLTFETVPNERNLRNRKRTSH